MANKVSVCSSALNLLGADAIADFAEDNDRARLCSQLFPQTLAATIRAHTWDAFTKRVVLSPLVAAPAFGWAYAYQIPSDCLLVKSIDTNESLPVDYVVEGSQLLTDVNPVYLKYLAYIDDGSTWDAGFVDVLTHAMAAALAYPITSNMQNAQYYEGLYQAKLRRARCADGQQGTIPAFSDSPFIRNRSYG